MKILISIVSKDNNFSISPEILEKFKENHPGSDYILTEYNLENITVVNNRIIEKSISEGFDYLVMMHADVEFDLDHFFAHMEECDGKYDVIGLCGCEKISISESPLNWFCGSRKYPGGRWGCVCHGELGNSTSFFSLDRKDITDHQVSCIDGLCIVLSKKAIEAGLRFDENLKFNCYDTQISFDAIMNLHLKVGVLVETSLKHFSVGKSILGNSFLEDEIILRNRFGFEVPKGSRLESFISSKQKSV